MSPPTKTKKAIDKIVEFINERHCNTVISKIIEIEEDEEMYILRGIS